MALSDDKSTVAAVIPVDLKEKLKTIAKIRRWSLSQTVGALIEDSYESWVSGLGINLDPPTAKPKRKRGTTP